MVPGAHTIPGLSSKDCLFFPNFAFIRPFFRLESKQWEPEVVNHKGKTQDSF
jgi:hypothetical protein